MNRIDYKFLLHKSQLPAVLDDLTDYYYVLQIEKEVIQTYNTIYFDTPDNQMYLSHQNGRLNRYKIRSRQYDLTKDQFLEVKLRTNKGRCIKKRMKSGEMNASFSADERQFLKQSAPYEAHELEPKIRNSFQRITLVSTRFEDRVTIDLSTKFGNRE
ncbi:MAG TPA: polyphosphate polymerase domain-containing protein, partial [Sunxiuqinia sp.]|nr:polyphosphate polymerase domain-containing protein [Sunxiuqinia sp.]